MITHQEDGTVLFHYLLAAVRCDYVSGTPVAADDASDAGWFTPLEVQELRQSPNLQTVLNLLDI